MSTESQSRSLPARLLIGFGHFWWDFLIGETPELFVGVLILLAVVLVLAKEVSSTAGWIALPLLVIAMLAGTLARARRSS